MHARTLGRLDFQRVRRLRRSGFDRARTARASDLPWHTRSTPARRRQHLHLWCGDLRNFARDLHWRADRRHRDSRVVLHRILLPIHFETAGLGSAGALLELLGHRIPALNFLGFYAAAVESALLIWLSVDKHGVADRAIHEHGSGWLIRIGEIFNGPLALVLRFFSFIPFAALSFLIGALVSRFGWIAVGKVSGSDPESVFAAER